MFKSHSFTLFLCGFAYSTHFINMESGFFHLAYYLKDSSMWLHIWISYYSWIMFHCIDEPHCLSINQLMDIWVDSYFWLLSIMLIWTFIYNFLCRHVHLTLLSIFLSVEFLGHMVTQSLTFWGAAKLFSKAAAPFYIPNPLLYMIVLTSLNPFNICCCLSVIMTVIILVRVE